MVRVGRHIDVDADAVTHGELDVPPIEHRQQIVLGLHCRVRAGEFEDRVPLVDDRRTVHPLGHQFRLEDPGGVLPLLRLLLLVDQEQRDAPVIAALAGEALDDDFGAVGIDRNRRDRAFLERQPVLAATGMPLPDQPGIAGLLADEVFAVLLDVLAPGSRQLSISVASRLTEKVMPNDDGIRALSCSWAAVIGRAVLGGVPAAEGQFVAVEDFAVRIRFLVIGERRSARRRAWRALHRPWPACGEPARRRSTECRATR